MIGKTERVILIQGDDSTWYEQVIFITNPQVPANAMPVDFVAQAEKIISDYNLQREARSEALARRFPIAKKPPSVAVPVAVPPPALKQGRKLGGNFATNFLMALACVAIVAAVALGFFR